MEISACKKEREFALSLYTLFLKTCNIYIMYVTQ